MQSKQVLTTFCHLKTLDKLIRAFICSVLCKMKGVNVENGAHFQV